MKKYIKAFLVLIVLCLFSTMVNTNLNAQSLKAKKMKSEQPAMSKEDTAMVIKGWVVVKGKWKVSEKSGKAIKVGPEGATIKKVTVSPSKCVFKARLLYDITKWDKYNPNKGTYTRHVYQSFNNFKDMEGFQITKKGEYFLDPIIASRPPNDIRETNFRCEEITMNVSYTRP